MCTGPCLLNEGTYVLCPEPPAYTPHTFANRYAVDGAKYERSPQTLFWGNRGLGVLTWVYADLVAPITRHRHYMYQSPFRCTLNYPCSTNQLI